MKALDKGRQLMVLLTWSRGWCIFYRPKTFFFAAVSKNKKTYYLNSLFSGITYGSLKFIAKIEPRKLRKRSSTLQYQDLVWVGNAELIIACIVEALHYGSSDCNLFMRSSSNQPLFTNTLPAGIYLLKVNNRNTRTRCEICSKLTIKTPG